VVRGLSGWGWLSVSGGGEGAWLETEEVLDLTVKEVVVVVSEFAVGIEGLELLGIFFSAEVAVLFHDQGFASEAGKGIEQASVIGGVFGEFSFFQGLENL